MKTLVLFLGAGLAIAQIGTPGGNYPPVGYPGQYPYPGGGGRYPGSGPGIPGQGGRRPRTTTPNPTSQNQPLANFRGKLKHMDAKSISLEMDDYRVLEFRVNAKTKYLKGGQEAKPADFKEGDQISVEGLEDATATLTAVNVYWEKAAGATPQSAESKDGAVDTWKDKPSEPATERAPAPAVSDPEDPGPPKLRRGKPSATAAPPAVTSPKPPAEPPPPEPAKEVAVNLPPNVVALPQEKSESVQAVEDQTPLGSRQEDPLIRKASEAALTFTESLPNYVVQESVTRYRSEARPASWNALDLVTTDVVYENGKEDYRNIKVNGKATAKNLEETGAWSTGEFGTVLIDLFSPATAASFHYRQEARIAGTTAKLYDFQVEREHSHWTLHFGAQTYVPAYSGSAWIDPKTGRVLRIEMQARNLPQQFPADHVESATDYQNIRLGGTAQFLLPVHAEVLSCQRGTPVCSKNSIDFRNYHKYAGESDIQFGDVKDDGTAAAPTAPAAPQPQSRPRK